MRNSKKLKLSGGGGGGGLVSTKDNVPPHPCPLRRGLDYLTTV